MDILNNLNRLYAQTLKLLKNFTNKVTERVLMLDLRRMTKIFVVFGLIFAILGSYFWYSKLYMTNEYRFWSAINNSLATKSVTRTLVTGGSGNEVTQSQRFAFAPYMASESKVSFIQKSALVNTAVVTEGVLFPNAQYSRYVSFETNQTKPDGTTPSLDSIVGKWELNEVAEADLEEARLSYVSELVSLAMFGNFDADFRSETIAQLRNNNVYEVSYNTVSEEVVDGEDVIVFPVSVWLKGYAAQVQNTFRRAGYGDFPPLNPDNYRPDSRIPAQIIVNKRNNSIVGINFGTRSELYSGYGIIRPVERPEATYNPGELEQIVQQEVQNIL